MARLFLMILIVIPLSVVQGQRLGEIRGADEPFVFPENTLGFDLMFGEGGFGVGGFYRYDLSESFTWYSDISISEAKDPAEVEYIDYFGNIRVPGKINRIFLVPITTGLQYRMFRESLSDNLRPYLAVGAGPSIVISTPFDKEFFSAFGSAIVYTAVGGYVGVGANFGFDENSLVGLSARYYVIHLFNDGIEAMEGNPMNDLGGFYIALNIGTMF